MENKLDRDYQYLLSEILTYGVEKDDRTGTGTLSLFGKSIRHDMSKGFPILTSKKVAFKTMVTELKWFLKGDTNIRYLVDNGCNIWNGDAFKNYISKTNEYKGNWPDTIEEFIERIKTDDEFAEEWGELGPIYGAQWRNWNDGYDLPIPIDQIEELIVGLKSNPNSRRHIVSAWNVGDMNKMVLPPCHYGFQCYVADGKLSLMWNQRSADLFLGVPFNISSYGLLLLLLCEETGYEPGELIGNFGDIHLYKDHLKQAEKQLKRSHYKLPTLNLEYGNILNAEFEASLVNYKSHPYIKAPLSN